MLNENLSNKIKELAGKGSDPLAVAFSGGGDSTALLSLVIKAIDAKRDVYALIVDHDLREGSSDEAKLAAKRAHAVGVKSEILKWEHEGPTTGIQEKARHARYALLGEACRRLGVSKLFLGHNRDDQAETVWMRKQKQSGWRGLAGMQVQVMAPIWPHLRGIEIIRPLLGQSRLALRDYNQEQELAFIEDPSNENLRFERIRARHDLMERPERTEEMIDLSRENQFRLKQENQAVPALLTDIVEVLDWGGLKIKSVNRIGNETKLANVLRYLLPSVSGHSGLPPGQKLNALAHRVQSPNFKGATFAGTRLIKDGDHTVVVRDPGMVLGRAEKPALSAMKLEPGRGMVWDGRYLIKTSASGQFVVACGLVLDKLGKETKAKLKQVPLAARKTLPAIVDRHDNVTVPFLDQSSEMADKTLVKSLISERLNGFFRFSA